MMEDKQEVVAVMGQIDVKTAVTIAAGVWALLMALLTPWAAGAVLWLIETRAGDRFARIILKILEADDNAPRVKRFIEKLFAERIKEVDTGMQEAMDLATANRDTLNQVNLSVLAHGTEMKEMKAMVKDVPTLTPTLERITKTMDKMSERMEMMGQSMARMDERQKAFIERRHHQLPDSPHRREEDDPQ